MRIDGNAARAARSAARREPIEYEIGDEVLRFKPEMSLDVLYGYDLAPVRTVLALQEWLLAHMLLDSVCGTECLEPKGKGETLGDCPAVAELRVRLRKIRVDGSALVEADIDDMWTAVREAMGVTEGESPSSAEPSETVGDSSSKTSDTPTTRRRSGSKAKAASVA